MVIVGVLVALLGWLVPTAASTFLIVVGGVLIVAGLLLNFGAFGPGRRYW